MRGPPNWIPRAPARPLPASRHWATDVWARLAWVISKRLPRHCPLDAQRKEQAGEPRAGKIDQIVEARRRPAEIEIALGLVADHRVGGVDRLVESDAGKAEDSEPEGRRHDAVGSVLGEAFERRARHARFIELRGIAPDDDADRAPPVGQRILEGDVDGLDMARGAKSGPGRRWRSALRPPSRGEHNSASWR